jgi:hypothetical protein
VRAVAALDRYAGAVCRGEVQAKDVDFAGFLELTSAATDAGAALDRKTA